MMTNFARAVARWLVYLDMVHTLRGLGAKGLLDLGIEEEDLPAVAWRLARCEGPTSIYALMREHKDERGTGIEDGCIAATGTSASRGNPVRFGGAVQSQSSRMPCPGTSSGVTG